MEMEQIVLYNKNMVGTISTIDWRVNTMNDDLKTLRYKAGLKQYEAAELIGISNDYLCSIENGKKSPSRKIMSKMADLYNKPVEEIFLLSYGTESSKNAS